MQLLSIGILKIRILSAVFAALPLQKFLHSPVNRLFASQNWLTVTSIENLFPHFSRGPMHSGYVSWPRSISWKQSRPWSRGWTRWRKLGTERPPRLRSSSKSPIITRFVMKWLQTMIKSGLSCVSDLLVRGLFMASKDSFFLGDIRVKLTILLGDQLWNVEFFCNIFRI